MDLERTVPWGRDFHEYRRMFTLQDVSIHSRLLGCGDGPSSFNAEATSRGWSVVSVDPLYRFSRKAIARRIESVRVEVMSQVRAHEGDYLWDFFKDSAALEQCRLRAMRRFLDDFDAGLSQGRYRQASLPILPFADRVFDVALCSHLLFLYSTQLNETLHVRGVLELCRVAHEVRIFPLISMHDQRRSAHLPAVIRALEHAGYHYQEVPVDYEFQRGATHMLHVLNPHHA